MRRIFALRGKGNSGKTTTIRLLYQLLIQNGFELIDTNFNENAWDFFAVFSRKGILIGITSSGDRYDLVHERLEDLINWGCTICLCACRTYDRIPPGTNAAVLEFTDYTNQFIEKKIDENPNTQGATNHADANILMTAINNML